MEALKIDLADYIHSGEGANGESFNHRTDPDIMMKLYNPGKVQQPLDEMLMARKVFELGIPTPEPGEYVTDGVRYGIRFRRIAGKVSYSRATADNPEKVGQYAAEFAAMCRDLHKVHVDKSQFESVKDRYYRLLEENPFFTPAQKDAIGRFIADAPDTDTAIHGDLQYSNAIFVGDKRYFIDLGDFCYGYNLFDVGMVYLCCCVSDEAFIQEVFHMPKSLAIRFWECFAPEYFGHDRSLKDITEEIMPYAGLKTLIVERDTKCPMPAMRACLNGII
ncbi:MAG: phosphotransferase [Bacteroidales bacterium]|nr:phosphotransferase [Bacteroidales bacterium]